MRPSSTPRRVDERRKFERVDVPFKAQVVVSDIKGRRVGYLRQIARGGFMVEPEKLLRKDQTHRLVIHDTADNIRIEVNARVCHATPRYAGFQFVDLGPQEAVEVGNLIGKYYTREKLTR